MVSIYKNKEVIKIKIQSIRPKNGFFKQKNTPKYNWLKTQNITEWKFKICLNGYAKYDRISYTYYVRGAFYEQKWIQTTNYW